MKQSVGKNQKTAQQEAKVDSLNATIKKRKRVLKGLKTRLHNMKERIVSFQTTGAANIMHRFNSINSIRQEVLELAQKLLDSKKIKGNDRMGLSMLIEDFSDDEFMGSDFQSFQDDQQVFEESPYAEFGEEDRAKMFDVFKEFRVEPKEDKQKDIRKIFIRLSNKLHPDRAKSDKQAEQFHQLMLQVNEAYQRKDVITLLEMEAKYLDQDELVEDATIEIITDLLEQKIEKLDQELWLINDQIDRTSAEIKNLRHSELGLLLSQLERAESYGEGTDAVIEQMEETIEQLENLKADLEDSIKKGKVSPNLQKWLLAQDAEMDSFSDDWLFEQYGENPDIREVLSDLTGFSQPEMQKLKNLAFPIDSSVKLSKKFIFEGMNIKGWQGRVSDAFLDENEEVIYEVHLDSISLTQIPEDKLEYLIATDSVFGEVMCHENNLKKASPRDTKEEMLAANNTLYHKYYWNNYTTDNQQQQRLQNIFLHNPLLSEEENWDIYFENNLKFPFEAYYIDEKKKHQVLKITDFENFYEFKGHFVIAFFRGQKGVIPFRELYASPKSPKGLDVLLEDYRIWQQSFYE